MSGKVKLQCSVSGFSGGAVTLLGMFSPVAGLVVAYEKPFTLDRREGFAFVTNARDSQERDALFTDADIEAAIERYFDMQARELVALEAAVARYHPENGIEPDGVKEGGRVYRIKPTLNCGQMAVLVMAWYSQRQQGIADTLGAFGELDELYRVTTIGLPTGGPW